MKKISAQKLSGKMVMDLDGGEIGILHNVVADAATGMLSELVVKPAAELDTSGFKEEDEYIFIPFQAVKAMKDVIIVDREEIRVRVRA